GVLMVGWLTRHGALSGFLNGPIGFGAHWHQRDSWRTVIQEPVLIGFGTVCLGIAWALRSIVRLVRREERWGGDVLLGLLALSGLAAYIQAPAPTPQAYFMTAHIWLLLCAVRLVTAWTNEETHGLRTVHFVIGVAGALLLLIPMNVAVALMVWGLVFLGWRIV